MIAGLWIPPPARCASRMRRWRGRAGQSASYSRGRTCCRGARCCRTCCSRSNCWAAALEERAAGARTAAQAVEEFAGRCRVSSRAACGSASRLPGAGPRSQHPADGRAVQRARRAHPRRDGVELQRIWQAHRKTVMFVTHSIREAVFLSDRVLVMGRRPATIVEELVIDLPRPRHIAMTEDETFNRRCVTFARRSRRAMQDKIFQACGRSRLASSSPRSCCWPGSSPSECWVSAASPAAALGGARSDGAAL